MVIIIIITDNDTIDKQKQLIRIWKENNKRMMMMLMMLMSMMKKMLLQILCNIIIMGNYDCHNQTDTHTFIGTICAFARKLWNIFVFALPNCENNSTRFFFKGKFEKQKWSINTNWPYSMIIFFFSIHKMMMIIKKWIFKWTPNSHFSIKMRILIYSSLFFDAWNFS